MEYVEQGPIAEVQPDGSVKSKMPYDTPRLRKHLSQITDGLSYCMLCSFALLCLHVGTQLGWICWLKSLHVME